VETPASIFGSKKFYDVFDLTISWMIDFISDNLKIEEEKIGPERNFPPVVLKGLDQVKSLLIKLLKQQTTEFGVVNYYSDFTDMLLHSYLPNRFGDKYDKKSEGYIIYNISKLICWMLEEFGDHAFVGKTGNNLSVITSDGGSINIDSLENFFLKIHVYRNLYEKTDPKQAYANSIKTIQKFLDNQKKRDALKNLLIFRFNKPAVFDRVINDFIPELQYDFYNHIVKDLVILLQNNCTAQQFMNFIFVQWVTCALTIGKTSFGKRSYNFRFYTYSRLFWLVTVVFEENEFQEISDFVFDNLNFNDNDYCQSRCAYIADVFDFGINYKTISECTSLNQFHDFLNVNFRNNIISKTNKLSRENKIGLVRDTLFMISNVKKFYRSKEVFEFLTDSLYGKGPNKEFLMALYDGRNGFGSIFDSVYYRSFFPVIGTWIQFEYAFRLIKKIFPKKEVCDSITLPQDPQHMKELIKCGFKFGKKPTIDDVYCRCQIPENWSMESCNLFDKKKRLRATIFNKIENEVTANLLQSKSYWSYVVFRRRYYYEISEIDRNFYIIDTQDNNSNTVFVSDPITCTDPFILRRRAQQKLLELFPDYKQQNIAWNMYWD